MRVSTSEPWLVAGQGLGLVLQQYVTAAAGQQGTFPVTDLTVSTGSRIRMEKSKSKSRCIRR